MSPLLTGVFQPFFQDPPTVQYPRTGWQAQLILSVPLFDGTLRHAQYAERKSQLARSRIQLDALLKRAPRSAWPPTPSSARTRAWRPRSAPPSSRARR